MRFLALRPRPMIVLNCIVVLHGDAEIVHPSLKIGTDFPVPVLRIFLMNLLSRDAQISPDKNVSFPCTIPSADGTRTFALGLPFHPGGSAEADRPLLAETPLPSARTFVSIHYYEHHRFSYRGLSPHKLTPVPGVHNRIEPTGNSRFSFSAQRLRRDRLMMGVMCIESK